MQFICTFFSTCKFSVVDFILLEKVHWNNWFSQIFQKFSSVESNRLEESGLRASTQLQCQQPRSPGRKGHCCQLTLSWLFSAQRKSVADAHCSCGFIDSNDISAFKWWKICLLFSDLFAFGSEVFSHLS